MAKEYHRPMKNDWWLKKPAFRMYMLRELTCVFVGIYAVVLLILAANAATRSSFHEFYEFLKSPLSIGLHIVVLLMVLWHTLTWLFLTDKVVVVWRGENKVPAHMIRGAHYGAWIAASVVVAWIVLG